VGGAGSEREPARRIDALVPQERKQRVLLVQARLALDRSQDLAHLMLHTHTPPLSKYRQHEP
jgi:hypothetical protein